MSSDSSRRLGGRRIAVVGAGSGIGRAVAELFASEGAAVAVMDLNIDAARAVAKEMGGAAIHVDVTSDESVSRATAEAAAKLGGLDGLVNSAGIAVLKTIDETTPALWRKHIDVNLTGTFLTCRAALPFLRKADAATIVNIASGQAMRPVSVAAAYAASKGGVISLTKSIALEGAPRIRANVVSPGLVDTPMHDAFRTTRDAPPTVALDNYPLRRWATAREIADAILFLTSAESAYVTGATLAVDGGRTMH